MTAKSVIKGGALLVALAAAVLLGTSVMDGARVRHAGQAASADATGAPDGSTDGGEATIAHCLDDGQVCSAGTDPMPNLGETAQVTDAGGSMD